MSPLALGALVAVFAAVNLPTESPTLAVLLTVLLGAATVAVVRLGRGLTVIGALAPACLAVAGIYTVAKERKGGYRSFEWPEAFDAVHVVGVFAVLALAAVAVISAWRDERGASDQVAPDSDDPSATT